jgi:hypothetical protein
LPLPTNCLVPGNGPQPLEHSHRQFDASECASDAQTHSEWEAAYQARAAEHQQFVVCKPLFVNVSWSAPVITDDQLVDLFDKIPSTQNPGRLPLELLKPFAGLLGIAIPPSSQ